MADIKIEQQGENTALIISGDLTVEHAAEFKNALTQSLEDTKHVILDLEHAASVDLSCLQLLCSANRTSVKSKQTFELRSNCAETFRQVVNESGYVCYHGCEQECEKSCLWIER